MYILSCSYYMYYSGHVSICMRKVRRMVQHLLRYSCLSSVIRGLIVYFLCSTVTLESKEFLLVKLKRNLHSSILTERSALCAVDFVI